jgi:hypothetical protein
MFSTGRAAESGVTAITQTDTFVQWNTLPVYGLI